MLHDWCNLNGHRMHRFATFSVFVEPPPPPVFGSSSPAHAQIPRLYEAPRRKQLPRAPPPARRVFLWRDAGVHVGCVTWGASRGVRHLGCLTQDVSHGVCDVGCVTWDASHRVRHEGCVTPHAGKHHPPPVSSLPLDPPLPGPTLLWTHPSSGLITL